MWIEIKEAKNLVLAEMDDRVSLFGYELRLQLRAELAWNDAHEPNLDLQSDLPLVADSSEHQR